MDRLYLRRVVIYARQGNKEILQFTSRLQHDEHVPFFSHLGPGVRYVAEQGNTIDYVHVVCFIPYLKKARPRSKMLSVRTLSRSNACNPRSWIRSAWFPVVWKTGTEPLRYPEAVVRMMLQCRLRPQ
jgi:hypothetical protein